MSTIIIIANGKELNFKKESLTIKRQNNALAEDFKVAHSAFPFLLIEDKTTLEALGLSDITSITKKKIIPVTVIELGIKYYGELQQLSIIPGYRKCNLKYNSDILTVINKKIGTFLPVTSVIPNETNPIPFSEEASSVVSGSQYWETFPVDMMGKIYPEVKFNFPSIYWKNKFGENLETTDPWYEYQNHINKFLDDGNGNVSFVLNTGEVDGSIVTSINRNIPMPHLFVLTPLYYIFQFLNWKIKGDFIEHELVRRTILGSKKDNLSLVKLSPEPQTITIPEPVSWFYSSISNSWRFVFNTNLPVSGNYKAKFSFEIEHAPENHSVNNPSTYLLVNPEGDDNTEFIFFQLLHYNNGNNYIIEGEIEFSAEAGNCTFVYVDYFQNFPINYSLEITYTADEKEFYQMHPTIDLSRYAPDWTVGSYLNYIKDQFNLSIEMDDFKKEISLNMNENITYNEVARIIPQSLAIDSYDLAPFTSFVLKYENEIDKAVFVTKDNVSEYNDTVDAFTKKIETKFKLLPRNGYTSVLSEDISERAGIPIMIYDEISAPFTSDTTISGFNLNILGEKGIYETFFKIWFKFLLSASIVEVTASFTESEIRILSQLKAVYFNNQRFRIDEIETTEAANNYKKVKMKLLSINF